MGERLLCRYSAKEQSVKLQAYWKYIVGTGLSCFVCATHALRCQRLTLIDRSLLCGGSVPALSPRMLCLVSIGPGVKIGILAVPFAHGIIWQCKFWLLLGKDPYLWGRGTWFWWENRQPSHSLCSSKNWRSARTMFLGIVQGFLCKKIGNQISPRVWNGDR